MKGYEAGWNAYAIHQKSQVTNSNDQSSTINHIPRYKLLFPWFYGEELEQVRLNGWSNGFILEESRIKNNESREADSDGIPSASSGQALTSSWQEAETPQNDEFTVVIVYLPQYLEWIGLGMILVVLGGMWVWATWKSKRKSKLLA